MKMMDDLALTDGVASAAVVRDGVLSISAAMCIGSAALMILGIQPIMLAALVTEGRLTDTMLGRLATVEVFALAGASVCSAVFFRRGSMRRRAALLCAAAAGIDFACCVAATAPQLFILRGLAGLLEGGMLGCAIVMVTRAPSPDRANGLFLAAQTMPQAIGAYLLPTHFIPRWGSDVSFVILALLSLIGAALCIFLPAAAPVRLEPTKRVRWVWTNEIGCILVAALLGTAGVGTYMEYLPLLATVHGLGDHVVGLATSGNLVLQVVGAFAVVGFAWRLPAAPTLLCGCVIQIGLALTLPDLTTGAAFVINSCLFGSIMLALGPFQIAWLVRVEPTRQVALIITPVVLVGWGLGPFIASFFVSAGRPDPAMAVAALLFAATGCAYLAAVTFGRIAKRQLKVKDA